MRPSLLLVLAALIAGQIDRCTTAGTVENSAVPAVSYQLPDSVFARMYGKSFKDNEFVSRDELRYIKVLHYGFDGKVHEGELVCHSEVADDLVDIFTELYNIGYRIESIRLIDDFDADDIRSMEADNSSAFNFRVVAGTKKLSAHARGRAIDINPLYNPYVKGDFVSPEISRPYVDRDRDFEHKINTDDPAYRLFAAHGWEWGGSWQSCKDYQHFEKP